MTTAEFQAALDAWAQAVWDKLHPPRRVRRKVQQLQRGATLEKAKPLKAGQAIPAVTISAARPTAYVIPDVPVTVYKIDHGWMAYSTGTTPPQAFADSTLQTYLSSSGTNIPPSASPANYQFLIGNVADTESECSSGHAINSWSNAPTLDANLSYAMLNWTSTGPATTDANPARHSGLGVAFAQALLGVGRSISAVLPSGWSYDPTKITLVRGPDGRYWLTKTDSAGCFLTELTVPADLYCLNSWVINGDLTGYAHDLGQALVIGNLQLPGSPTIYEVLTSAAIAGVYSSSAIDLPLWGWQWSEQKPGATDEDEPKAVLVTIYTTGSGAGFRCVSRTSTITLNWDGSNDPQTATLDTSASGSWRLNRNYERIFRTDTSYSPPRLVNWDPSDSTSYFIDVPGPLAAWWDADAEMVTVEWGGIELTDAITNGWPDFDAPVTGADSWQIDQLIAQDAGLLAKVNVAGVEKSIFGLGERTWASGEFSTSLGTPVTTYLTIGGTYDGCTAPAPPGGETWTFTEWPASSATFYWAKTDYRTNASGVFIIAFGPPRTCWFRRTETAVDGSINIESKTLTADVYPSLGYDHEYCGPHDNSVKPSDYGASWVTDFDNTDLDGEVTTEALALLGSTKVDLDGGIAWWDDLMALAVGGYVTTVPLALLSAGGLVAFTSTPGATPTWTLPAGLDSDATAGNFNAWVGGS